MSGNWMSSMYCVFPVTWLSPSRRSSDFPTVLSGWSLMRASWVAIGTCCNLLHGSNDGIIASAATQVAAERFGDLGRGGVRIFIQQRLADHQHTGRAEAALHGKVF